MLASVPSSTSFFLSTLLNLPATSPCGALSANSNSRPLEPCHGVRVSFNVPSSCRHLLNSFSPSNRKSETKWNSPYTAQAHSRQPEVNLEASCVVVSRQLELPSDSQSHEVRRVRGCGCASCFRVTAGFVRFWGGQLEGTLFTATLV